MRNLKQLVEAVENNNEMNESKWLDWSDADHIINIYCDSTDKYNDFYGDIEVARRVLNKAIGNNGETVQDDLFEIKAEIGVI